jgi:hypothetical protein
MISGRTEIHKNDLLPRKGLFYSIVDEIKKKGLLKKEIILLR